MGAVIVELFFEVIHVEALVEGAGNPFIVFCSPEKAGEPANSLKDRALEEQGSEADNVAPVLVTSGDPLISVAGHVTSSGLGDVLRKNGEVCPHKAVVWIGEEKCKLFL